MKTKTIITLITAAALTLTAYAGEKKAGPSGGRIVTSVQPHFELFVTPDMKLKITFLTADGKPTPPATQTLTAIGGDRSAPTRFTFIKENDTLISEQTLPEGKEIALVLQIKPTADAKSVTERITLNLANCPTCKHQEYACTCDH